MGCRGGVLAGVCCLMAGGGVAAQEGAGARDRAGGEPCQVVRRTASVAARLPDLCVESVAVSPARFLSFTVRNRGSRSTSVAFTAEVYLNGVRQETVAFAPLAKTNGRRAEARVAQFADCGKGTIRLVLDPQNVVTESDELNNDYSIDRGPPCPDVTASIDRTRVNSRQYRIQIRIVNEGTARMSAVNVGILAAIQDPVGGPTLGQCETAPTTISVPGCLFHTLRTSALAPGQSRILTVGGNIPVTRTAEVKVTVKCVLGADCLESNGTNNVVSRILGPPLTQP